MGDDQHVFHEGFPVPASDRISLFHRCTRTGPGVFLFCLVTVVISILPQGFITIVPWILLYTHAVPHVYVRRFLDWAVGQWMLFFSRNFELFFGIRVRMFGSGVPFSKHSLIILNHRCHFDWFFFWMVAARAGDINHWTVMVKYLAKMLPIFGWAMQFRNLIFLTRKWDRDSREVEWKLRYLCATNSEYQMLVFPEGTDLNPSHKEKGDQYADRVGWSRYNYCLHPKSTGFLHTIKILREKNLDTIYDMTVGYPDVLARTELDMFNGRIPREIHYHSKVYKINELPRSDQELEVWLRERWREKEERLRLFYTYREFREVEIVKRKRKENDCEVENIESERKENPISTTSSENGRLVGQLSDGCISLARSPEVVKRSPMWRFLVSIIFFIVNLGTYMFLVKLHWFFWVVFVCSYFQQFYLTHYTPGIDYTVMKLFIQECGSFLPSQFTEREQLPK